MRKANSFSWSNVTGVNPSNERAQAGLFADICRVHAGDEILFYLERPSHDIGREGGRFFGIFEVVSPHPIYEPQGTYLLSELGMPLPYRLLIKPKVIYPDGLTEWQLMDEMTDFRSIFEIPWTLIYRKMTAKRGCTPLLPHETAVIKRMLDLRNAGQQMATNNVGFSPETISLHPSATRNSYLGNTRRFDKVDQRLMFLMNHTERAFEIHLQAYLMQEIKRNPNLTSLLFPSVEVTWIGNEIYCGSGMQSIDILIYSQNEHNTFVHLLELKSQNADEQAAAQLNRYIKWLKVHIPGISVHQIIPTIVAPEVTDGFHNELRTFLTGHGISQYREIRFDGCLRFVQRIFSVH
ncbi:MAG: hypothetical protein KMY50_05630 [Candidatus Desulforudis sp.]|nr:hypothetical protein [Desulforudis sp.]